MTTTRTVRQVVRAVPTSDGAGVRLYRSLGQHPSTRLDPFLLLDEFASGNPDDYLAGFPSHPHRGFETVTYMLEGHMLHEDHLGKQGHLQSGGAQWMTAGRGIIHSEMPRQEHGRMHGFQLWINLPAREKMKPAGYRNVRPDEIPAVDLPGGGQMRLLAGRLKTDGSVFEGPVSGVTSEPLFADVRLDAGQAFAQDLSADHNAVVYAFEGRLDVGPAGSAGTVEARQAALLSAGDRIETRAGAEGARFLLLAARPVDEPVVQYGPFVMNSREEIEQALEDYRAGRLAD